MKKLLSLGLVLPLYLSSPVASAEGVLDAENFSANIAITSNYLFRGITLSNDDGAVSGGFDWGYNGFYVGTWASSISAVETESFEIDYYGGYAGELGGFSYSLDIIYYDYPGEAGGTTPDLAYLEYGGSLGYTFDASFEPTIGVSVLHSPDFFAESGNATAVEGSLDLSLPADFGLSIYYGNQDLDSSKNPISDYDYYGIVLSKSVGIFDLSVGYSDTDSDGETFQGSDTDEIYFTIGASI